MSLLLLVLACDQNPIEVVSRASRTVKMKAQHVAQEASREKMACDAEVPQPAVTGCLSGELRCGEVIEGTTVGGESSWDDRFYAAKFCLPALDDHGGPERVYRLVVPAYTHVSLWLESDCVDLDLIAASWTYDGRCPTESHSVPLCEADNNVGGDRVEIYEFKEREYLVAVDGKYRATGPFRLHVSCEELVRPEDRKPWPH